MVLHIRSPGKVLDSPRSILRSMGRSVSGSLNVISFRLILRFNRTFERALECMTHRAQAIRFLRSASLLTSSSPSSGNATISSIAEIKPTLERPRISQKEAQVKTARENTNPRGMWAGMQSRRRKHVSSLLCSILMMRPSCTLSGTSFEMKFCPGGGIGLYV